MTAVQTRRTGTGYKAGVAWVIEQWIEMPHSHWDATLVNPAGPERRTGNLPWEICAPAPEGYPASNGGRQACRSQQRP